ncbi:hypothetical protein LAZ67_5001506 [Cordylochernes scorpioides]|uniref:Retrovirus-related Pol polyprotein from transposon TNT 1-94-like beta-barrel domain-containing protein n=1 Tax=Cordylochernes scorpioides TaxID=51811 RepID=A0ABY6KFN0_9ARAC|nr:hypothetical protein LAZ67_5001506 [Cordylochernes scorpioides]
MENSVQVPKFDGKNFASWKFRIVSILEGKELDDLLEGDPPEDEVKFKEWKKKDAQAKGIITCVMTDSLVALILNCKTSKDIWIALHERYEGDKKKKIIEARNDVSRLTMRKEENWEEYLYRAEKLLEQARNLGADIQDQEFTTSVIRGLPQKYNLVAFQLNCQMKAKFVNLQPEEHVSNIKEYETTQQPEEWVIDSGASCHMALNRDLLKEEREVHKTIKLADDSEIISNAEGAIEIEGQNKLIRLNDVLYVEKLSDDEFMSSKVKQILLMEHERRTTREENSSKEVLQVNKYQNNSSTNSRRKCYRCGVLYWKMFERNAIVNKDLYIAQLHRVNEAIQQKRPDRQGQIILLHDNARPPVAQVVKAALQELECEVLQYPPYSPDVVPTDYHLFSSISNHMRGTTFNDEEDLKTWLNNFFDTRQAIFGGTASTN